VRSMAEANHGRTPVHNFADLSTQQKATTSHPANCHVDK